MKIVQLDEKLKRNYRFHPFLIKGNSVYGVIYRRQRATRWTRREPACQFISVDMRTGGHATLDIPHAKLAPTWSQDGLTYLTREARSKNHDQIGLYQVDLENYAVHKRLEVHQPKDWLYTGFSSAFVVFRTYILPGGAFWLTQLTNGYWEKCDNYFFDGSSAQARLIEAVPEYVAGVESFVVGEQDVLLLRLGLPAWDQREEAWESGQLEAMEQQEKEAIIQVPSAYIDSPSEFHQVHGSTNHSALGGPFTKIGDKLLYSVLEFGQPWELRSYDPVTANISRRALEDYMNYIPLVDGQPYLYELQQWRYLLTSFFGERSFSYPSRWGMPEGVIGNLLFSRYNPFLDGGPRKYSDHEILVHDLETGELVAGGITFLFGPSGPILFV